MKPYELPAFPFATLDALEPYYSAEMLEFHYDKHHRGIVDHLNLIMEKIAAARAANDVTVLGALERQWSLFLSEHLLHSLLWKNLAPANTSKPGPSESLVPAIEENFGSLEALQHQLITAVSGVTGPQWVLLTWEPVGERLLVETTYGPSVGIGKIPLLVIDVWEHAYHLQYRNMIGHYAEAAFQLINWTEVTRRFEGSHNVLCNRCGKELTEPGALLFSPPAGGMVAKWHLCPSCYLILTTPAP